MQLVFGWPAFVGRTARWGRQRVSPRVVRLPFCSVRRVCIQTNVCICLTTSYKWLTNRRPPASDVFCAVGDRRPPVGHDGGRFPSGDVEQSTRWGIPYLKSHHVPSVMFSPCLDSHLVYSGRCFLQHESKCICFRNCRVSFCSF